MLAFPDDQGVAQCRMVLERGRGEHCAAWLMCNPSTADAETDDPTNKRVVHFSARSGYARSLVGNMWAYRTPYPRALWEALAAGRYTPAMANANLDALAMIGGQAAIHVVAVGTAGRQYPKHLAACLEAFSCGKPLYALGTTADGWPLHPLARGHHFIPADTNLRPWTMPCP